MDHPTARTRHVQADDYLEPREECRRRWLATRRGWPGLASSRCGQHRALAQLRSSGTCWSTAASSRSTSRSTTSPTRDAAKSLMRS